MNMEVRNRQQNSTAIQSLGIWKGGGRIIDSKRPEKKSMYRIVYECYKPSNLEEAREYIQFVLRHRRVLPNVVEEFGFDFEESTGEDVKEEKDLDYNNLPPTLSSKLRHYLLMQAEYRRDPHSFLFFDSNFECGNVERVVARSDCEYELFINSDTNAIKRNHWYFLVENTKAGKTVRFTIANHTKPLHFLHEGMKPMVFSEIDHRNMYTGWTCRVENCGTNKIPAEQCRSNTSRKILIDEITNEVAEFEAQYYYSYTFTHTFKFDNDRVYFCFCKPYAYSRLQNFYSQVERPNKMIEPGALVYENKEQQLFYSRKQLALSVGGVPIDIITIAASSACLEVERINQQ